MTTVYRRALAAGLVAGTLTLSMAGVASAHASLVRANIKPGQVFAHNGYPRTLTAFFAENVNPKGSWVHVFEGDPKGDHAMVEPSNVQFPSRIRRRLPWGCPGGSRGCTR